MDLKLRPQATGKFDADQRLRAPLANLNWAPTTHTSKNGPGMVTRAVTGTTASAAAAKVFLLLAL
jgi:hypothetical protein